MTDQVSPNGPLAKAIEKVIANRQSNDGFGHHMPIIELEQVFRRTQGDAEYESWFAQPAEVEHA